MNTPIRITFPFTVWGRSIVLGSVFLLIIFISNYVVKGPGELMPYLLALILFSAVFSWPSFLLCYFAIKFLSVRGVSVKNIRIANYILALAGILSTARFFEPDIFEEKDYLVGLICYIAGLTISFFTIKIDSHTTVK